MILLGLLLALPAFGAEVTRVLSSFDDENDQPFGFRIVPSFEQRQERGDISREGACTDESGACPFFNSELSSKRVTNTLNFDIGFGLYHDLEVRIGLPVVLSDRRTLTFADGVSGENSTVAPAPNRRGRFQGAGDDRVFNYSYFDVGTGNEGPNRAGLGDMSFGIAWGAFSQQRNDHLANLVLAFDYTAPTGTVARGSNTGVGRGVHEMTFSAVASRQFSFFDPYFGLAYTLPLRDPSGLFEDRGINQQVKSPGQRVDLMAGAEMIMFENRENGQRYTFQFGLDFGYTAEGRDYNPLFDALAASGCNGTRLSEVGLDRYDGRQYPPEGLDLSAVQRAHCAWIVQQMSNERPDGTFSHDGITNVEGHAHVGGHFGFNLQFSDLIQLRIGTQLETRTSHFLTGAYTGRSASSDDRVDLDPAAGERNPDYNPTLDAVGNRFRYNSIFNFGWNIGLAIRY